MFSRQAAASRFQSKPSGTRPQQTSLSSYGRDLDRYNEWLLTFNVLYTFNTQGIY